MTNTTLEPTNPAAVAPSPSLTDTTAADGVAPDTPNEPAAAATAAALPGLAADRVAQLLGWAVAERAAVHLIGPHGIGKTAYVRAWAHQQGLRVVERSLPVCSTRDFCVPLPVVDPDTGRRQLETVVLEELQAADEHDRYVLVLDEFSRAERSTFNTAMELLQEHTLAGQSLPGLAAVVALDNPFDDPAYTGVSALDLAQADRLATLQVAVDDIPWRDHLCRVHGRDLTAVYTVWGRLPAAARQVLCPRVLDHLIALVDAGLPAGWALPVPATGRLTLPGPDDEDATVAILDELAATIRATAPATGTSDAAAPAVSSTDVTGPSTDPVDVVAPNGGGPSTLDAAIAATISRGWQLRVVGPPGIGKTSQLRDAIAAAGYDVEYLSLATTSPQDLVVPVPVAGSLQFLPAARLLREDRSYVLVLDEFARAPRDVAAAAMELVNERTLAGQPLPGCVAVVALDNPTQIGGIELDTGRIDTAQASRFTATIEVSEDDLPWREVLTDRHGEAAVTFLVWRAEDLDDAARALVTPRCLDRLLSLHAHGLELEAGLPLLHGERVPVSLASLRRRLRGDRSRGITAVLDDLDGHLTRLADGDTTTELAVHTALSTADPAVLADHLDAVSRLLAGLGPNHRLALLRHDGRRRELFVDALHQLAA